MFYELLSKKEKKLFGILAKKVVIADRIIREEEKQYIAELEKIIGKIDETISYEKAINALMKLDNTKKRAIITELLIIAKCDKNYADEEKQLIQQINSDFGIPQKIFKKMDSWSEAYIKLIIRGNTMIEVDL